MFTGIVAELGWVAGIERRSDSARVTIAGELLRDLTPGESVAVNGVCLTAALVDPGQMTADVMAETLARSTLRELREGEPVNLERPVTPTTVLGGHIMQGHVDGIGTIAERRPGQDWELVVIEIPTDLDRYVVAKGSIAIDGVSLTVIDVEGGRVSVSLIPETLRRTTLGARAVGDRVNLEVDVLAKYVEKLVGSRA
jgi:riboflavin synthase